MEQHALSRSIRNLGIDDYFEMITGIDDHYANGKEDAARRLMSHAGLEKKHCMLIGDTLHDAEVAQVLGIDCILVSAGHQSEERLLATGYPVVVSLADLLMFL
jgi:phosphoglycolate phosphatase